MGVEIINHEVPPGRQRISLNSLSDVVHEVLFSSRETVGRRDHLASRHIEVDDERPGTMPNELELLPFYLAGRHRQTGVLALQGLDTRQLIGTHHPFACLVQFGCLAIQRVDVLNLLIELVIADWRQPIAHQVRFEIGIFLKASPHVWARWCLRCHVS